MSVLSDRRTSVFSVVTVTVIFGILEVLLRLANPAWMFCFRTLACPQPRKARIIVQQGHNFSLETGEPLLVYDPDLLWSQRPNVQGTFWGTPLVRTNRYGIRQGPVDQSARRNVLLVGDSVVWGSQVKEHERFGDCAQAALRSVPGLADVQLINAGVIGYSSSQVLRYLQQSALRTFKPEVVVACVGVNDCWNVQSSDHEQFRASSRLGARVRRSLKKSNLYLFFDRYIPEAIVWLRSGRNPEGFRLLAHMPSGPATAVRVPVPETVANFREIGDLVEEAGAIPILILEHVTGSPPVGWNAENFRDLRASVRELARRRSWETLDMRLLSEDSPPSTDNPNFLDFCHPTPRGHAIMGRSLSEALAHVLREGG
jgi:lysophospholipase L1-like esterase